MLSRKSKNHFSLMWGNSGDEWNETEKFASVVMENRGKCTVLFLAFNQCFHRKSMFSLW